MIPYDADFWTSDDSDDLRLLRVGLTCTEDHWPHARDLMRTWAGLAETEEPRMRVNHPLNYSLYDQCHLMSLYSADFTIGRLAKWYKEIGDPRKEPGDESR